MISQMTRDKMKSLHRAKIIHLSQLSALQRNMKGASGMNVSNSVYEATKVLAEWKETENK